MICVLTTETRLSMRDAPDIMAYARAYVHDFCSIERHVWHRIVSNKGLPAKSAFNTEIQQKFGVTKRTANSIIYDMNGRYKALKELKETERREYQYKIRHLEEKLSKQKTAVNVMKTLAKDNLLDAKQLARYRNEKRSLYFREQKLQRYKDRLQQLEDDIANDRYFFGFGGRKTFRAQHLLTENGFADHASWKAAYVKRRDSGIFYLGSKDETAGNQMFTLYPQTDGSYMIRLRKDGKYVTGTKAANKYIYGRCSFSYLDDEIRNSIQHSDRPVSYRIKIRGRKVYLQAMVTLDTEARRCMTTIVEGAIGLDFNDGHIDLSETDAKGNLVHAKTYWLYHHGTGSRAENEMRTVIAEIGTLAMMTGKTIVKEDLSFIRKKSKTTKGRKKRDKDYNRMLHTLDYSRFEECLKNMSARLGVEILEVNPAYTSRIGKQKYAETKKLPVHLAAAYVIARRGQGFRDTLR